MIGIRCDANSIIASGHMMRCLTIAKVLSRYGEYVTFFMADQESFAFFKQFAGKDEKVDAIVMNTSWQNMEAELPALVDELQKMDVTVLLVDSYSVTREYFYRLKEICTVAYIDDLNADTYPVDMLINYSGYYETLGYEHDYKDIKGHDGIPTKLLLGLNYAPLREQFYQSGTAAVSGETGRANILLTSGGADTQRMLLTTLKKAFESGLVDSGSQNALVGEDKAPSDKSVMQENDEIEITWQVVVGSLVKDYEALEEFAKEHPTVTIHRSVSDMAGLMKNCNIAVCAAGTMLTECAAMGLPVIFYQVADNQKYNVKFWQSTGGMIFAGDVIVSAQMVTDRICKELKALLSDEKRRSKMAQVLRGYTDGKGAIRIADALLDCAKRH